jgi:hypothetical protein
MSHALMAVPEFPWYRRLSDRLVESASGRGALVSVLVFVVFSATVLPWQAAQAREAVGEAGSPDTSFWYSADRLYALAEAYGEDGRSAYVLARVTFDVVWPLVYTAMLVLVIGWLLRRSFEFGHPARLIVLLPVAALLADYAENICTAVVMARYPDTTPVLAELAGVATAAKWTTLSAAFLMVPVLAVVAFLRRGRNKPQPTVVYQPR